MSARPGARRVDEFLRKVYELYADFALKVANGACQSQGGQRVTPVRAVVTTACIPLVPPCAQNPFYETDMPIRCDKFDAAIEAYVKSLAPATLH